MSVVVRFAPSPTGFIHIGGMRVALINWLFARQHAGRFVLRIEDTDRARSRPEFVESIDRAMDWLGLNVDERVMQSESRDRYVTMAHDLVNRRKAYYCYCSQEEIQSEREEAACGKKTYKYSGKCRGNYKLDEGRGPYVIRIDSAEWEGVGFDDMFYGRVEAAADNLSDTVIMRSNGLPTFIFAAAVDDAHLGVTHVMRGNDHMTNTFLQVMLMKTMGEGVPAFGHIPLLLNAEGEKLSKRHGAADLMVYRQDGFYAEAVKNYLVYLGGLLRGSEFAFNDGELLDRFDVSRLSLSPARFDVDKMRHINGMHMRRDQGVAERFFSYMEFAHGPLSGEQKARVERGVEGLVKRSETLVELKENADFCLKDDIVLDYDSLEVVKSSADVLAALLGAILNSDDAHAAVEEYMAQSGLKKPKVFGVLRAALMGCAGSLPVHELLDTLGTKESVRRIRSALDRIGKPCS